ncbi:MAG: YicC/YloC family endoribonuclease [Wujia sp.]
MIKSMTGFGRSEIVNEYRKIVVEIKAVNHRYCDMTVKLPKKLNYFESAIRNYLKDYIQRGKVDVYITYEDYSESNVCVKYNKEIAAEYISYLNSMVEEFGLVSDLKASVIGRFPEVFTLEEKNEDEEVIWEHLQEAIGEAAEKFVQSRITEGEHLRQDLLVKLDSMDKMVGFIEEKSPEIIALYKDKLIERVSELSANTQIDDQRIATEVTLFADKICVDEEIVRLKSHIDSMRKILVEGGSVGRKLDFIAQEMNREANTILSKSNSLQISDVGIDLKTEIEKVREQIQNIE